MGCDVTREKRPVTLSCDAHERGLSLPSGVLLIVILIVALAAIAVLLRKLTPAGGAAGAVVAWALYSGLDYPGLALLGLFFILGTLATSYRKKWKEKAGLRDNIVGRRAVQVWANGGVAAVCALGAVLTRMWQHGECMPGRHLEQGLQLAAAAALSSATADTLASELGNAWGSRYINIRSLRRDVRGVDGAISLEGSLAGLAGSVLIATIYFFLLKNSLGAALLLVAAGTLGNAADSWLGATLQRRGILNNDAVNFCNTLLAALFAGGCFLLFG
ncbi:MAG: DUF92 domain-containing protein [Chitinophagaceae bacterium]|nr:MAG: DUF92 domain-containing protein [Chitinophagaceae bacterium]